MNELARWEARFSAPDFVFGTEPNEFLRSQAHLLPRSGKVLVKKLKQLNNNTLVNREQDYANRLQTKPVAGDIELFS